MMMTAPAANPLAAYLGGKRNLAKRLCAQIATIPHCAYAEPFVGMGGIFFRRQSRPPAEMINDLAGDVPNLFRVVRRHYQALVDELEWQLAGRADFDRHRRVDPSTLTDIERAARFLYLQRLAFGGRVNGRTFGVRREQSSRINLGTLRNELRRVRDRLEPVTIEQLPWSDFVRRYDGPGMLFYLDPPYDETEGYGVPFGRDDYVAMAEQLAALKGRFLLSINATPFVRETFAQFTIQEVDTTWMLATAATGAGKRVTELIISN
jgi:DNA adenine methylase